MLQPIHKVWRRELFSRLRAREMGIFSVKKMVMENAIVQLHITYEFGLVHRHFLDLQYSKNVFLNSRYIIVLFFTYIKGIFSVEL